MIFPPASFLEIQARNAWAKDSDVEEAVKLFKSGDKWPAKNLFLKAAADSPENSVINYYLGVIYLEEGNKEDAVKQWKEYVRKDASSENSLAIRKNLTQLEIELAKENAKKAVANEAALMAEAPVPNSLAVTYYTNLGSSEYAPLSKGMTAMLITDLSKVQGLQLVERAQVQALMDEMKLGMAGFTDTKQAPKVGKLLKAEHVAGGNYADEESNQMRMTSSIFATKTSSELSSGSVKGSVDEFWDLEKKVAVGILTSLGYTKDSIPEDVYKVHTKDIGAFTEYSKGLDHLDKGDLNRARKSFQNAVKLDPDFDLAGFALIALPMAFIATSMMASSAAAAGPSSAAAAAGSSSSTAVQTTSHVGRNIAIIGGASVAGAGAVYYAVEASKPKATTNHYCTCENNEFAFVCNSNSSNTSPNGNSSGWPGFCSNNSNSTCSTASTCPSSYQGATCTIYNQGFTSSQAATYGTTIVSCIQYYTY